MNEEIKEIAESNSQQITNAESIPDVTPKTAIQGGDLPNAIPAKTAQQHAAEAREAVRLRKFRKELRAKDEIRNSELAAVRQRESEREKQIAELSEKISRYEQNPLSATQDPESAIRSFVEGTTPEKEIALLKKELADARAEFRKTIEDKQKEFGEASRKAQEAAIHQQEESDIKGFVKIISEDKTHGYRYLRLLEPEDLESKVRQIQEYAKTVRVKNPDGSIRIGARYSYEEVASFLDGKVKKDYEKLKEREALLSQSHGEPEATSGIKKGEVRKAVVGNDEKTAQRPNSRSKRLMTREEEEAEDIANLRKAAELDRAHRSKASR